MDFLLSCGSNLKLFEIPSYNLKYEYGPFNGASVIKEMAFSSSGELCVAIPEDGYLEVAAFEHNYWRKMHSIHGIKHPTVSIFQRTIKEHIAIAMKSNDVVLYNLKHKIIKKRFAPPTDQITLLDFNAKDTHLAVGCRNGDILLYDVRLSISTEKLMVSTSHNSVSAIRFHSFQRSLFAAANDVGDVVVWDINTRKKKFALKNSHCAPCAGIAFSPVNNTCMTSIGYDCTFNYYDLQNNVKVISKLMEHPLCSHDIMYNGHEIAMGTHTGIIYSLDLRNCKQVLATVKADDASIKNIAFKSFGNLLSNSNSISTVNISSDIEKRNLDKFHAEFELAKQNVSKKSIELFLSLFGTTNRLNLSMTTVGEDCANEIISKETSESGENKGNFMDRPVAVKNDPISFGTSSIPMISVLQKTPQTTKKSPPPIKKELKFPTLKKHCSVKEPCCSSLQSEQCSVKEAQVNVTVAVDRLEELLKKHYADLEEQVRLEFMRTKLCVIKQFVYDEYRIKYAYDSLMNEIDKLKSEIIDLKAKLQ